MKKIKYLLLLGLFAMISTGCVKFNANMDIKKDKSMEFSIIYAFDKSLMGEANSLKEDDFKEVEKEGFTVEKYSKDNYEGFKLTKKISNIDEVSTTDDAVFDLSGMMQSNANNKYIFKVVKGEDKNTYYAKLKFDANDSGMTGNDDALTPDEDDSLSLDMAGENNKNIDLSGMMSNLDLSFTVNLPYSAISSNATTKENDNKKLIWKLGATNQENIEFVFELKNNETSNSNVVLFAVIGVLVLAIVIVLALVLSKKKNNSIPSGIDNSNNENQNEPKAE